MFLDSFLHLDPPNCSYVRDWAVPVWWHIPLLPKSFDALHRPKQHPLSAGCCRRASGSIARLPAHPFCSPHPKMQSPAPTGKTSTILLAILVHPCPSNYICNREMDTVGIKTWIKHSNINCTSTCRQFAPFYPLRLPVEWTKTGGAQKPHSFQTQSSSHALGRCSRPSASLGCAPDSAAARPYSRPPSAQPHTAAFPSAAPSTTMPASLNKCLPPSVSKLSHLSHFILPSLTLPIFLCLQLLTRGCLR